MQDNSQCEIFNNLLYHLQLTCNFSNLLEYPISITGEAQKIKNSSRKPQVVVEEELKTWQQAQQQYSLVNRHSIRLDESI